MPTLFVLVGLPCTGKTTWRNKMVEFFPDTVVISRDDYIEGVCVTTGLAYTVVFNMIDQGMLEGLDRDMYRRFGNAISERKDIIIDMTNLTIKSREKWMLPKQVGYNRVAVCFCARFPIIIERNQERIKEGKYIPEHVLEDMWVRLKMPQYNHINETWFDIITNA